MLRTVAILACCALLGWGLWTVLGTVDVAPVDVVGPASTGAEDGEVVAREADADFDPDAAESADRSEDPAVDRVDVAQPVRSRAILGRLTIDGRPAQDLGDVEFRIEGPYGQMSWTLAVGSRGSFRVPIDARPTGGSRLVVRAARGAGKFGTRIELPDVPVTALEVAVGEVELAAFELLAHGRVVDDVGAPVANAVVHAHATTPMPFDGEVIRFARGGRTGIEFERDRLMHERERAIAEFAAVRAELERLRRVELDAATVFSSDTGELEVSIGRLNRLDAVMRDTRIRSDEIAIDELVAETTTLPDGSYELFGPVPAGELRLVTSADGHRPAGESGVAVGTWVELVMVRTASLLGSAILPAWLPARAVEFRLFRDGFDTTRLAEGTGRVEFAFDDIDPGEYSFEVRMWNLPGAVVSVQPIELLPGPPIHDPRVHDIDLTRGVMRYRLRARDERGLLLTEIHSPLLVRFSDGVRGFNWRDGAIEVFAAQPELVVTLVNQGFRVEDVTVSPGDTDLVFHALNPIEVLLPGLRAACGPGRKVRVSMILESSTGLPTGIQGVDQRTGETHGYSRWHLSKSGGAWLGDGDLVRVPLIRNGRYQVVIRLHEEDVPGDVSLDHGMHDVVLDDFSPHRIVVEVDAGRIEAGIQQLLQRRDGR